MFENPRRGRQARNFGRNVPKILDLKSSSEQISSENCRWVPLHNRLATTTTSRPFICETLLKLCSSQMTAPARLRDSTVSFVIHRYQPTCQSTFESITDIFLKLSRVKITDKKRLFDRSSVIFKSKKVKRISV